MASVSSGEKDHEVKSDFVAIQGQCCDLASYKAPVRRLSPQLVRQIGQVLVASLKASRVPSETRTRIAEGAIGGIYLAGAAESLNDDSQFQQLTRSLQEARSSAGHPDPLLIGIEQEGGLVSRLSTSVRSTQFPSPLGFVAGRQIPTLRQAGEAIGKELHAVGINWNIAPVIDPVSYTVEPLDVCRRFGSEPEDISAYAASFIEGLHNIGIATCVTEALTRSLNESYRRASDEIIIDEDFKELIEQDILPLRRLRDNGMLDCIALSSCALGFDDARRSRGCIKFVIEKIVREYLGYDGPIVIDCAVLPLETSICAVHAPLHALLAGTDMVFLHWGEVDQHASVSALHAAIEANESFRTAVIGSAGRVSALKARHHIRFENRWPVFPTNLSSLVAAHRQLALQAYRASITACQSGPSPLLSLPPTSVVLLLTPAVPMSGPEIGQQDPFEHLGRALSRSQPRIRHVPYSLSAGLTPTHLTFLQRVQAIILVLACTSSALTEVQSELWVSVEKYLTDIEEQGRPTMTRLVVSAGDVRDLFTMNLLSKGWWGVACWDHTRGALEAVAEVLTEEREATGRMPIEVDK